MRTVATAILIMMYFCKGVYAQTISYNGDLVTGNDIDLIDVWINDTVQEGVNLNALSSSISNSRSFVHIGLDSGNYFFQTETTCNYLIHDFSATRSYGQIGLRKTCAIVLCAGILTALVGGLGSYFTTNPRDNTVHPSNQKAHNTCNNIMYTGIGIFGVGLAISIPLWKRLY
jgi:hypothetical protein